MTQYVGPNAVTQTVTFEVPEPQRLPGPGTVDVSQLGHQVDPRALKVFQKAVEAIAHDDHKEAIQPLQEAIEFDSAYAGRIWN